MSTIEERIKFVLNGESTNVIPIRREIVAICNNNARDALLLTQLIYWCSRVEFYKDGWAYESAKTLEYQLGLTESMIRSATKNLLQLNFIETKTKYSEGHPTRNYKIKEQEIISAIYKLRAKEQGIEFEDYEI